MTITIELTKLENSKSKYEVRIPLPSGKTKNIKFGAAGYEDYTIHKDPERKNRYIARHKTREKWGINKKDMLTKGWWSLYLLWNKPTISKSIKDIESKLTDLYDEKVKIKIV